VRWRSLSTENRAYLPAADLAQKLRDTQTPLFGVESQKSLAEFDILGFSLSYELGATNILEMLTRPARDVEPEAGTQRLRDIINKGLTNEELLHGVKTGFEQGWDKIKLYFMIGLPGETDVDVVTCVV
jgi:hypothetical protein